MVFINNMMELRLFVLKIVLISIQKEIQAGIVNVILDIIHFMLIHLIVIYLLVVRLIKYMIQSQKFVLVMCNIIWNLVLMGNLYVHCPVHHTQNQLLMQLLIMKFVNVKPTSMNFIQQIIIYIAVKKTLNLTQLRTSVNV